MEPVVILTAGSAARRASSRLRAAHGSNIAIAALALEDIADQQHQEAEDGVDEILRSFVDEVELLIQDEAIGGGTALPFVTIGDAETTDENFATAWQSAASAITDRIPTIQLTPLSVALVGRKVDRKEVEFLEDFHPAARGGRFLISTSSQHSAAATQHDEEGFAADVVFALAAPSLRSVFATANADTFLVTSSSVRYSRSDLLSAVGAFRLSSLIPEITEGPGGGQASAKAGMIFAEKDLELTSHDELADLSRTPNGTIFEDWLRSETASLPSKQVEDLYRDVAVVRERLHVTILPFVHAALDANLEQRTERARTQLEVEAFNILHETQNLASTKAFAEGATAELAHVAQQIRNEPQRFAAPDEHPDGLLDDLYQEVSHLPYRAAVAATVLPAAAIGWSIGAELFTDQRFQVAVSVAFGLLPILLRWRRNRSIRRLVKRTLKAIRNDALHDLEMDLRARRVAMCDDLRQHGHDIAATHEQWRESLAELKLDLNHRADARGSALVEDTTYAVSIPGPQVLTEHLIKIPAPQVDNVNKRVLRAVFPRPLEANLEMVELEPELANALSGYEDQLAPTLIQHLSEDEEEQRYTSEHLARASTPLINPSVENAINPVAYTLASKGIPSAALPDKTMSTTFDIHGPDSVVTVVSSAAQWHAIRAEHKESGEEE